MAERSPEPSRSRSEFSRGRLAVGLVLVVLLAGGLAFGLRRLRAGPDLGRLVYATDEGVFVRELESGESKRAARLPGDTLDAWPDPSGRWLGYLRRRGDLWMLDLDSGRRWRISERLSGGLGWMPDGRFVAGELLSDGDLVAVDPEGRATDLLVSGFRGGRIFWRNETTFVAAIGDTTVLIDVAGTRPQREELANNAWPLAVSPDGSELLYVVNPGEESADVAIADIEEGRLRAGRTVFAGTAYRAAVSRQGFVAFSGRERSNDGGTWVLRSRSKPPRRVAAGQAESIEWSLDGSSLVYVINGSLYARDLRDDRSTRLSPKGSYVKAFAVVR